MARKKKTQVTELSDDCLYKVTSKGDTCVRLGHKMIMFDEQNQAVVTKDEYLALKEMGVIV